MTNETMKTCPECKRQMNRFRFYYNWKFHNTCPECNGHKAMNKPRSTKRQSLKSEIQGVRFSNPRRFVTVDDWPSADGRTQMRFGVLTDDRRRERAIRWSKGKPKLLPHWYGRVRIVDGDNGKHYIIAYTGDFEDCGRALVYRADMKPECVLMVNGECDMWWAIRELCYV